MKNRKLVLHSGIAFATLGLLAALPAAAQEGIETIIVTAQKRSENMQKVPISVVAITATDLQKRGLTGLENVSYSTPSLNITHTQSAAKPFLRGIGSQDAAIGNESAVAVYIDDVYLYNPYSLFFSFNNIQQIEVLKGPQGTLYGRNAVGGLINIRTRDPQQTPQLDASVSYGNYDTKEVNVYATAGITKKLAADIAFRWHDQGRGYGVNYPGVPTVPGTVAGTGLRVHYTNEIGARTKWLWEPGDLTKVTFTADYARVESDHGTIRHAFPGTTISAGLPFIGETFCGVDCYQNDQQAKAVNDTIGTSLRIDHAFGDLDFSSISAYRATDNHNLIDQDGSPRYRLNVDAFHLQSEMYSQELQLKSSDQSKVKWIVGAFYMHAYGEYDPMLLTGLVASGLPGTNPPGGYNIFTRQTTESRAVFAQASTKILPKLTATVGLRYTSDKVDDRGRLDSIGLGFNASLVFPGSPLCGPAFVGVIPAGTSACQISQSNTFNKLTWRGTLDYEVTDNILAYFSASRGFKAGVYNLTRHMDPPARPEVLDAFEVGTKMDLAGGRVRWNTTFYYYKDTDIQLTQNNGSTNLLSNAASGKNYGGEIELQVVPVDHLNLSGGIAFTHARYKSFPGAPNTFPNTVPPGGNLQNTIDAAGNKYIQAPEVTFNIAANYVVPLATLGEVDFNVAYYYNGGFYWEANNRVKQNAYGILNAGITYTSPNGMWDARIWGKNLTDERYNVFVSTSPTGDQAADNEPLTFGVTLGVHL